MQIFMVVIIILLQFFPFSKRILSLKMYIFWIFEPRKTKPINKLFISLKRAINRFEMSVLKSYNKVTDAIHSNMKKSS